MPALVALHASCDVDTCQAQNAIMRDGGVCYGHGWHRQDRKIARKRATQVVAFEKRTPPGPAPKSALARLLAQTSRCAATIHVGERHRHDELLRRLGCRLFEPFCDDSSGRIRIPRGGAHRRARQEFGQEPTPPARNALHDCLIKGKRTNPTTCQSRRARPDLAAEHPATWLALLAASAFGRQCQHHSPPQCIPATESYACGNCRAPRGVADP